MRAAVLALWAVLACLTVSPALAQEAPPIEVSMQVQPPAATLGDRVTLTLLVTHGDNLIVTVDPPHIDQVDLVSTSTPPPATAADGRVVTTVQFVLQPFALGDLDAGPLAVRWLRDDGASGSTTVTPPALTVVPIRQPGDEALRPLKAQESVAGAPPAWQRPALYGGLVAIALALLGGLAWWLRRGREVSEAPAGPDVSSEREARRRLDGLRGRLPRSLPARDSLEGEAAFQHYYGEIALVVRAYLEERFGFNASALTTPELEARMRAHGVDRWQARLVGGLLERCDRAVYARRYPDPASADHDLTVAYEIVELSRPNPRPDAPEAVPA